MRKISKKGFTLIELLAIIVILAIIAVITVPIILGIVDDSKAKSSIASAYGFKDAVSKMYMTKLFEDRDYEMEDKVYTVSELSAEGLSVSGKEPGENSWIQIENNEVISGCLQFDEYKVDITNGEVDGAQNGMCSIPPSVRYASLIVTTGDGLYESQTEPGRLIYRGANPNNRIFLKEDGTNNTLYRIVSYEPDGTIKVVREDKLSTNMAWDNQNARRALDGPDNTYCSSSWSCNVWGNMNNTYYNGQKLSPEFKYRFYSNNSTESLQEFRYKGTVTDDSTLNQYLNETWLTNVLSNYIDNHDFNVGGVYYVDYSEVGKGLQIEKAEEKLYTWTGKVGLLNITEYVESSTNSSCIDVWSNYYYNTANETNMTSGDWPCKYENYNYKSEYHQWTLSPYIYYPDWVWIVWSSGLYDGWGTYSSYAVRPAFYLKSGLNITGTGAVDDEFIIE